jgi:hypothetical protein
MFFAPENAGLNVKFRFTVRLFLEPDADEVEAFTMHWLF